MFKTMLKRQKSNKGFTLVELMIVIAIIGILAIVLIPQAAKMRTNAKLSGVEANMRLVQAQLEGVIDDCITPAELSGTLQTKLGTMIKNPFGSGTGVSIPADANTYPASSSSVVIYTIDSSDTYFAAPKTASSKANAAYAGTVIVAITGAGDTLAAKVYGYDDQGNPITTASKAKTVAKK